MDLALLGQLAAYREYRIERGHRFLKHHADLAATHATHLFLG